MFRVLSILIAGVFAVCLGGCEHIEAAAEVGETQERSPVKLVRIDPEFDTLIATDSTIRLYFDGVPRDLTSNIGAVVSNGKTVEITLDAADFKSHYVRLRVAWVGGKWSGMYQEIREL